jgi:hypothetical protein
MKRVRETATWASKERESVITMPHKKRKPGGRQRMTRKVSREMPASPRAPRAASSGAPSMDDQLLRRREKLNCSRS